jgi:hypothetical protein
MEDIFRYRHEAMQEVVRALDPVREGMASWTRALEGVREQSNARHMEGEDGVEEEFLRLLERMRV